MNVSPKSSPWRSRLVTLAGSAVVLLVVALILVAIGWTKLRQIQMAMSAPPPPEAPVTVELSTPQPTQFRQSTVVVGTALAERSVMVRNEVTGIVTDVAMAPGGQVKAGDLLLQFDDRVEQAQLKAAQATLRQSVSSLERAKRLERVSANSAQELDLAIADVERSQAEVSRLNVLIDRMRIMARFDAHVGLFDLHAGQYLDAGSDIVKLEGVADFLHIDLAVPAHVADHMRVGESVTLRADSSKPSYKATIVAMDSRANPETRSLTIRAKLNQPPKTLLPGDSVLVTVEYGPAIDAILIPQTAVRRGPAGTTVFLAVEKKAADGSPPQLRAESIPVALAGSDGTMSRVIKGVSLGDHVVTNGSFKIIDGSLLGTAPTPDSDPSTQEAAQ